MLDYTKVTADDLEMVRESKRAIFSVLHVPTDTMSVMPVIPGTEPVEEARYHSLASLPKGDTRKGVTGFVSSLNPDNVVLFKITVRGGNEYLQALATDPVALRLTFEGVPKVETMRKPKAEPELAETPQGEVDRLGQELADNHTELQEAVKPKAVKKTGKAAVKAEASLAVTDDVQAEVTPEPVPEPAEKADDQFDILAELEKLGR
jgi:hypothetical protein